MEDASKVFRRFKSFITSAGKYFGPGLITKSIVQNKLQPMADNTNSSFSFLNPEYPSLMSGGLKYKYVSPEHLSLDLDLGKY